MQPTQNFEASQNNGATSLLLSDEIRSVNTVTFYQQTIREDKGNYSLKTGLWEGRIMHQQIQLEQNTTIFLCRKAFKNDVALSAGMSKIILVQLVQTDIFVMNVDQSIDVNCKWWDRLRQYYSLGLCYASLCWPR